MSVPLDSRTLARANAITMLPRFPAAQAGPALLKLVQSSSDAIVLADASARIVLVNQCAENLFGRSAGDLLEAPLTTVLPSAVRRRTTARLPVLSGEESRHMSVRMKVTRGDGSHATARGALWRLMLDDESYLLLHVPSPRSSEALPRDWPRAHQRAAQLASERRNRRFSRALYDDIGQRLSALRLDLDWVHQTLPAGDARIGDRIGAMQLMLNHVIGLTRSIASQLRPPVLDDFGLIPATEWLIDSFRKRTGIRCTFHFHGEERKLDEAAEAAAFRLIEEALSNIERHAQAQHVELSVSDAGNLLEIMLRDDGVGMHLTSDTDERGCGLASVKERILGLGGTIRIENIRPHGTQLSARVPLEQADPIELNQYAPAHAHDPYRNRR